MTNDCARATARGHRFMLWLPLIIGAITALLLLEYVRATALFRVENAAFGRDTARFMPSGEGQNQCADDSDSAKCIAAWRRSGSQPTIVWFGNSQLEGINRYRPGDLNAPELLHRRLGATGRYVVTYSQPNANLTEEAIVWNAIGPLYRPRLLILPVCYDDIRELGVRNTVVRMMDDPAVARRVRSKSYAGNVLGPINEAIKADVTPVDGPDLNLQSRTENALTNALSNIWPLWNDRINLRGLLSLAVHGLRNKVLGIHSTSKRPVDPAVLADRLALLDGLIADARAHGTQVLVYAPPYRQDIDGPYPIGDYGAFKRQLAVIAAKHSATFLDIDAIVPGPEWATVTDDLFGFQEPDFMHFTARGHARLAAHIEAAVHRMGY